MKTPTKTDLAEMFNENINSQWHQKFSTMVDSTGRATVTWCGLDYKEHFPALDGLLDGHRIEVMSRTEWYCVRFEDDHEMTLYRTRFGSMAVVNVTEKPIYSIFDELFTEGGGYSKRSSELDAEQADADDCAQAEFEAYYKRFVIA